VIDEPSLARFGQWPWPRTRLAELVKKIGDARPAAIGLDLFFPEPDRFSPDRIATELTDVPEDFTRWLAARRGNDVQFAEAIAERRVVLGIAAGETDPRFTNPPRGSPVRVRWRREPARLPGAHRQHRDHRPRRRGARPHQLGPR
jgi:CHASE2 domain-containing sensor protein